MPDLPTCVMTGVQPERKGARHDTWLASECGISTSFSSIYGTHLCETSFCSCKTSDDVSGNRPVDIKQDVPGMPADETDQSEDVPGNRPVDDKHDVPGMPADETSRVLSSLESRILSLSHDAGFWYVLPQRLTDGADAT